MKRNPYPWEPSTNTFVDWLLVLLAWGVLGLLLAAGYFVVRQIR